MSDLLAKISSDVSSVYVATTQHSRGNDLTLRANLRKAINQKLKPYLDSQLIASFKVICDESNNKPHDSNQPVKVEVHIKMAGSAHQHTISLPAIAPKRPRVTQQKQSSSFWSKLFRK